MCPEADDFRNVNAFSNEALLVRKVYDFSKDGGAISVIDLLKANVDLVIEESYVNVKAAVTSAGAPTLEVGIKGGDTDAIMVATVKANLLVDTTIDGAAASKRLRLLKDEIVALEIKVAILTAGIIEVVLVLRPA